MNETQDLHRQTEVSFKTYLPPDLERWMTLAIDQEVEGPKLDFKRELNLKSEELANFLKDVCAIANTDDPDHFDNAGCLIVGVERNGTFHPLAASFNSDKESASINELLSKYVAPSLNVKVAGPFQHARGQYAVVYIPPSHDQPHMIIKETGSARPGDWWVRSGDVNVKAGPEHYARVLRKGVERTMAPLRDELSRAHHLITNLEQRLERLQTSQVRTTGAELADQPNLSVAAKIRAQYGTKDIPLRQAIYREMSLFFEKFEAQFPDASVEQQMLNWEPLKEKILTLEGITRPLGEGMAAAVMHGEGALDDVVAHVLLEVTKKTLTFPHYRSLTDQIQHLRSYPQILLTLAVCGAAMAVGRTEWLKAPLKFKSRHFLQDWMGETLDPTRQLVVWEGIFSTLFPVDSCTPAYEHINAVVLGPDGWLLSGQPFIDAQQLINETELFQSLTYMDGVGPNLPVNSPIPNSVIYRIDADEAISHAIKRRPAAFKSTLSEGLPPVLERFVNTVATYNSDRMRCRPRVTRRVLDLLS